MKKMLALLTALLMLFCLTANAALAEAPCSFAREKSADYIMHYEQEEPIDEDWFLDAVMIGDSITDSLNDYSIMDTLIIDALIGQSPQGAFNNKTMRLDGQPISMANLAIWRHPKKLLIMLGSNGLDMKRVDQVAADYHTLLDIFLEALPDTEIYLLSISPVRKSVADTYPNLTMANIWKFNGILQDYATEHGVHYIDITTSMCDDTGHIKREYCTGDGAHLKREGAQAVMDAIRMQVIPD